MKNPWVRKGLNYYAKLNIYGGRTHVYRGTVQKKMTFIAYHMIKWYHGEEKLIAMAYDVMEHFKND